MTILDFTLLTAGLAAIAAVGFLVLRRVLPARNLRVMRCPDSGAITFVDAETVACGPGKTPIATVRSCDLWPQRQGCAQGCLQRYEATRPGYRINVDALRPFERT